MQRSVVVHGVRTPVSPSLPRMVRVSQTFSSPGECDIGRELRRQFADPEILRRVPRNGKVAVAVGSRGVAKIREITRGVVQFLRDQGAQPFIVPAMGSHGGATAEGQLEVLESLGVTEAGVGAPIVSSMEVVELGRLTGGSAVYWDRRAYEAGAAVVIGRVKPHTAFRGRVESGLIKMAVIGVGKQRGAHALHAPGFGQFATRVLEAWDIVRAKAPLLFGVAVVEDAYDVPVEIAVVPAESFLDREPPMLERARNLMARLPIQDIDVLVVQEIGKNISGDGMDPNVTGRYPTPFACGGPVIRKIAVLDLTPETCGNANGIGLADFVPQRVLEKIDLEATYMNALTSTVTESVRLPLVMATDRDAVEAAVVAAPVPSPGLEKVVYVRNTLALGELAVSEAALPDLASHATPAGVAEPLVFSEDGVLVSPIQETTPASQMPPGDS